MGDITVFIIWLLLVALALQVDFIFYIVYVMVGIYGFSLWWVPRAARRLAVERRFNDHTFLGERVPVEVRLHNQSLLPIPWLEAAESVPVMLQTAGRPRYVFSLRGHGRIAFTYEVQATRRGYYRIGPLRLRNGDLFGFSEQTSQIPPAFLTVYPRITSLARLGLPSRLPFGTIASRQRLFEDPSRPVGVRDYRAGDSLRRINWKVSAHSAGAGHDLMVKTLEPAISLETSILLNLDRAAYERDTRYETSEWAIEVAASLAAHLTSERQPVGLMTNGADPLFETQPDAPALLYDAENGRLIRSQAKDEGPRVPAPIPPRPGRAHLMKVLEMLARIELNEEVPFQQWAPGACMHLSWGVTILVITPQGDIETCNMLHRLVRSGYNPVLLAIEPHANFGLVRERARRLGFAAFEIARRGDLKRMAARAAPALAKV